MMNYYKKIGLILFSIMFLWSGFSKIQHFDKNVASLIKKTNWNVDFCKLAMSLVILLQIVGIALIIDYNTWNILNLDKKLIGLIILSLLIFIAIVTLIYHPLNINKPIPFLSNLSLFGLLLYVYSDYS